MHHKLRVRFMKECPVHGLTEHRGRADSTSARCIQCQRDYFNNRRKDLKEKAVEYKGGECAMCGLVSDIIDVYDFHHEDSTKKEHTIGHMLAYPWSSVVAELDKCMLLCANCHRIVHVGEHRKPA